MRIFLVVEETHFYTPNFIAEFLRRTRDEVVGAALVTRVPKKNNMFSYLRSHWYYLRPAEFIKLAWVKAISTVKAALPVRGVDGPFYSVSAVLRAFHVATFDVQNSINRPEYLDRIRALTPDVIISSNPLIFGERILRLPKCCCLNRHSALLPANGGLWPVFQAVRKGEKHTGVTIHTMERQIDQGIFLIQKEVPINPNETVWDLYTKTFQLSADALIEALDKVRAGDQSPQMVNNGLPSYYSFPTREHWKEFRTRGGRFI